MQNYSQTSTEICLKCKMSNQTYKAAANIIEVVFPNVLKLILYFCFGFVFVTN